MKSLLLWLEGLKPEKSLQEEGGKVFDNEKREGLRRESDREREAMEIFEKKQADERAFFMQLQQRIADRREPARPNPAVDKVLRFLERDDAEIYVDLGIKGLTLANRFVYIWAAVAGLIGFYWLVTSWWRDAVGFLSQWADSHPPVPPH